MQTNRLVSGVDCDRNLGARPQREQRLRDRKHTTRACARCRRVKTKVRDKIFLLAASDPVSSVMAKIRAALAYATIASAPTRPFKMVVGPR